MVKIVLRPQSTSELDGLTVVMPCYKEDNELVTNLATSLQNKGAEVIVVDDGGFMDLPNTIGTIRHTPNMGYGYSLKKGIRAATNDIVATADSDGQHLVEDVVKLYHIYKMIDDCKMVVGARWNLKEKPLRWIARKCLNFMASIIAGHYMVDLNGGLRVINRDIAIGYEPILCDTFSFTTSLSMSMVTDKHKIAYFPINVQERKYGKSRVRLFRDGLITVYYIIWVGLALKTRKVRAWLRSLIGQ